MEIQCCKWQSCVLILGVCALVQVHCEGDFDGTGSHILKLPYAMKVPFHEGSHATSVVITCKVVIEMAQRKLLLQSCAVVRLLWEVLSRCCSFYVHGGTGSMQWRGGSGWLPRAAAEECDGAAAQEQGGDPASQRGGGFRGRTPALVKCEEGGGRCLGRQGATSQQWGCGTEAREPNRAVASVQAKAIGGGRV